MPRMVPSKQRKNDRSAETPMSRPFSGKRNGAPSPVPNPADARELIAKRAYELYVEGGCRDGREVEDWLEAEREVLTHAFSG